MKASIWKSDIIHDNETLHLNVIVPANQLDSAVIKEYLEEYLCMIGCDTDINNELSCIFSHKEEMQQRWMEIIHKKGCYIFEQN